MLVIFLDQLYLFILLSYQFRQSLYQSVLFLTTMLCQLCWCQIIFLRSKAMCLRDIVRIMFTVWCTLVSYLSYNSCFFFDCILYPFFYLVSYSFSLSLYLTADQQIPQRDSTSQHLSYLFWLKIFWRQKDPGLEALSV